ncbi:MAG: TlpA disulfide reductase family protein [Bacteroidota bacterium]
MNVPPLIKKNWSNFVIIAVIALLFIPQTAMPIKVFFSRLLSFSPSEIAVEKRTTLNNYQWQLASLEGEKVNLVTSEEKVILINFWATWCPPCVAEMPSLQNLYDDYGDRVDFYFVSMEDPEKIAPFMEKRGYDFPVFIPIQEVPNALKSNSLPTTYLISKTGAIVIDKSGAADWNSTKVRDVLDQLLSE